MTLDVHVYVYPHGNSYWNSFTVPKGKQCPDFILPPPPGKNSSTTVFVSPGGGTNEIVMLQYNSLNIDRHIDPLITIEDDMLRL